MLNLCFLKQSILSSLCLGLIGLAVARLSLAMDSGTSPVSDSVSGSGEQSVSVSGTLPALRVSSPSLSAKPVANGSTPSVKAFDKGENKAAGKAGGKVDGKVDGNAAGKFFGRINKKSLPLQERAALEIGAPDQALTEEVLSTPATVHLSASPVISPVRGTPFRLGVGLQSYQPAGWLQVAQLEPYDLSALGGQPMLSLEVDWLPVFSESLGGAFWGVYGSVGYARHGLLLRGPVVGELEGSALHSFKIQGGFAVSRGLFGSQNWILRGQLGIGQMETVQTSTSSFANLATGLVFGSAGIGCERVISRRFSFSGGYERRAIVGTPGSGAGLTQDNLIFSVMGNFQ
jgi:hypothetical protein